MPTNLEFSFGVIVTVVCVLHVHYVPTLCMCRHICLVGCTASVCSSWWFDLEWGDLRAFYVLHLSVKLYSWIHCHTDNFDANKVASHSYCGVVITYGNRSISYILHYSPYFNPLSSNLEAGLVLPAHISQGSISRSTRLLGLALRQRFCLCESLSIQPSRLALGFLLTANRLGGYPGWHILIAIVFAWGIFILTAWIGLVVQSAARTHYQNVLMMSTPIAVLISGVPFIFACAFPYSLSLDPDVQDLVGGTTASSLTD